MKNKIISIILTIVTLFSIAAIPAGAAATNERKLPNLVDIWQNGYPIRFDPGSLLESMFVFGRTMNEITGIKIFNEEKLVVVADETLTAIMDNLLATSGVDFSKIYKNLPSINTGSELVTSAFNLDIPETQAYLKELSRSYKSEGNVAMGLIIHAVAIWLGIVDEVEIVATPVNGKPTMREMGIIITYRDGRTESAYSGIFYDEASNSFVGKDGGPALLGFSLDLNQNMMYTGVYVWQRSLGFNIFFDIFCYLTPYIFHYTTQRIKFDYDSREWMIQVWKGRYAITSGGEVGVYTRDASVNGTFYDCAADEDMLVMSLAVYHGDELLFAREPMRHWWMTGFELSDTAYLPHSLTLISTITMKDEAMLKAVTASLDKKRGIIDYTVEGLDVTITW